MFGGFLYDMMMSGGNECIKGKGFYISYNPTTSEGKETALVRQTKKGSEFFILLGDYRKQYKEEIENGYASCKKLFNKLIKEGAEKSPWSN